MTLVTAYAQPSEMMATTDRISSCSVFSRKSSLYPPDFATSLIPSMCISLERAFNISYRFPMQFYCYFNCLYSAHTNRVRPQHQWCPSELRAHRERPLCRNYRSVREEQTR